MAPPSACLRSPLNTVCGVFRDAQHRAPHLQISLFANPLAGAGFWTARLTAFKVIGKLAWLFVWPAHLSADYSFNAVPLFGWQWNWEDAQALLGLALCLAGAFATVRWRRTQPAASFFIGFFFAALAPSANLVILIGSIMAERFLYLASIGLAGCTVVAARALVERTSSRGAPARHAVRATAVLVCLAFAARTYARNLDWQDALTLWTSAVEVNPAAALSHNNLGNVLMEMGRLPDAIAEFQTALRILPASADTHFNLGIALESVAAAKSPGRLSGAIDEYRAALRFDPGMVKAHVNLGMALAQIPQRVPGAIAELQEAIRLQPDSAKAHDCLGLVFSRIPGRLPDAIAEFQAASKIDPDFLEAHYNLAYALAQIPGRLSDAIAECQETLRIDPGNEPGRQLMASLLAFRDGRGR